MIRQLTPDRHAIHERLTGDEPVPAAGSNRGFGVFFAFVFAVIGLLPLLEQQPPRWWTLAGAGGLLLVATYRAELLAPFNRAWFRLGVVLQRVVNPLVLGLLFYFVVTPTGVLMRFVGRDLLGLRRDPDAESYWIHRDPAAPPQGSMKNQF